MSPTRSNLTESEMDADRVRFWKGVYKAGVDSPDGNGCDDMLSLLRTDVIPGARDVDFLGVVIRIKDDNNEDDEGEDYDATVACVLCLISALSLLPQVCSVELEQDVSALNLEAQWIVQGIY